MTFLQVNVTVSVFTQGSGAAQADKGAMGRPDTDLARGAQRNAQVSVKLV